jgi:PAS domain S-box-containing protein
MRSILDICVLFVKTILIPYWQQIRRNPQRRLQNRRFVPILWQTAWPRPGHVRWRHPPGFPIPESVVNAEAPDNRQARLALLARVYADAPDAVFVTDGPSGRIVLANAAACALCGYSSAELVGRSHVDLHAPDERSQAGIRHRSVWTGTGGDLQLTSLRRADGTLQTVEVAAHPLREDGEDLVVALVRPRPDAVETGGLDLAESLLRLQEHNRQLERRFAERTGELTVANQQLTRTISEANQRALALQQTGLQRTQFFAGLAHEMRTPLNAVMGLADLLTDMRLDDEARHTARLIHSSARALVRLINDLLDHSRLEAGKLELVRAPYNLHDLLGELADITSVQCDDLGLSFALQVDGDLPDPVLGDEGRLRQVLLNLLGNALKYTREGGVTLNVRRAEALAPRVKVEFRITDTGIGISPEQQANLFQPYSQATAGLAAGSGSSGLGLAISRMLVERMGGRIGVESDEGWGSTFWFTLPLEPAPASAVIVAPAPAAVGREQLAGRTVLLVEDNRINQQVAIGMLKRLGVTARTADNGEAALAALAESAFDVVFMDVQMPGMDGLEATRHLRSGQAGELNRNVPVIAMTGHVSREDRDACTGAGMNDYVAKPISGDRLREAIARVLAVSPAAPAATAASDVAFDLWALAEQLDGDRDLAAEIFTLFLDDSRERLLLMAAAVRNYDCDTVAAEAKTVEGAAQNVHAAPLARQAAAIGAAARHRECEYAQALISEMTQALEELAVAWGQTIG